MVYQGQRKRIGVELVVTASYVPSPEDGGFVANTQQILDYLDITFGVARDYKGREITAEFFDNYLGIRHRRYFLGPNEWGDPKCQEEKGGLMIQKGAEVIKKALNEAGIKISEVNELNLITCTPWQFCFSHQAFQTHHQLGLSSDCGVYEYQFGCGGFAPVLQKAIDGIVAGRNKIVVILMTNYTSIFIDPRYGEYALRYSPLIFGDGLAAIILRASPSHNMFHKIQCFVDPQDTLMEVKAGGTDKPFNPSDIGSFGKNFNYWMDLKGVVQAYQDKVGGMVKYLQNQGLINKMHWLLFHQATPRAVKGIIVKYGLNQERALIFSDKYGNLAAVTTGLILDQLIRALGMSTIFENGIWHITVGAGTQFNLMFLGYEDVVPKKEISIPFSELVSVENLK